MYVVDMCCVFSRVCWVWISLSSCLASMPNLASVLYTYSSYNIPPLLSLPPSPSLPLSPSLSLPLPLPLSSLSLSLPLFLPLFLPVFLPLPLFFLSLSFFSLSLLYQ